jgi:site-specific recombinase XerD
MTNPITRVSIRLPKPLPRSLKDGEVEKLLAVISDARDRAMFMLMLRSGLRVEEVAHLTVDAVEYRKRQVFVANGKGAKDRVIYLSDDAASALLLAALRKIPIMPLWFLSNKGSFLLVSINP